MAKSMDKPPQVAPDKWQQFLSRLSPRAASAMNKRQTSQMIGEKRLEFQNFRNELSPLAQTALAVETAHKPDWPEGVRPRFIVVLMPDGERPEVHICPTIESAVQLIRPHEGKDTYVTLIDGMLSQMTTSCNGERFFLHSRKQGWAIRMSDLKLVELTNDVQLQTDGYLGPPELAMLPGCRDLVVRHNPKTPAVATDDEFDEEEEPTEAS